MGYVLAEGHGDDNLILGSPGPQNMQRNKELDVIVHRPGIIASRGQGKTGIAHLWGFWEEHGRYSYHLKVVRKLKYRGFGP